MLLIRRAALARCDADSAGNQGAAPKAARTRLRDLPCYDRETPFSIYGMSLRSLIALLILVLPATASSATSGTGEVWHAVAAPPRAALPTVSISFGYPGPYISPVSAPMTLCATAGDLPFNGYIGFHLAVKNKRTFNTPVMARAVLRPHQSWAFTTQADLHYWGDQQREVVIEWLDRSMEKLASCNSGVPPWSARALPLRVLSPGQSPPSLSPAELAAKADTLPDVARWYSGFRSLLVPVSVWLDLSPGVRKAIFASGVYVVFSGLPGPAQHQDAIDRALLPVTFDPRPGSYETPWPYRVATSGPVAVSMSWHPKPGSSWTGLPEMPSIVSNQVATWVADETALGAALPAMTLSAIERQQRIGAVATRMPGPAALLRVFIPLIATILVALLSIAFWLVMRKKPRFALPLLAIGMSTLILLGRDRIRPSGSRSLPRSAQNAASPGEGIHSYDIFKPRSPGVIQHDWMETTYGEAPLPEKPASPEVWKTTITKGDPKLGAMEVESATTAPGWGTLVSPSNAWNTAQRYGQRRELGESAVVRIQTRTDKKLTIEYESPMPVDFVAAEWIVGDKHVFGEASATGDRRGHVTIESGTTLWAAAESWWSSYSSGDRQGLAGASVRVSLSRETRQNKQVLQWVEPFAQSSARRTPFMMHASLKDQEDGTKSCLFALPVARVPPGARAVIGVAGNFHASEVTVAWDGGSVIPATTPTDGNPFFDAFAIPPEIVRQAVERGGVVKVTLKSNLANTEHYWGNVWIKVLEKKP